MGTADLADDTVPAFSPWSGKGGNRNVDFVAPGAHIHGLRVVNGHVDANHPEGLIDSRYFRGSGTSQSTAIVSGAAALILQKFPAATPDQVKALLTSTAQPINGSSKGYGGGELRLASTYRGCVPWVSVNMSPLSFREAGLVDRVRETLTANRLAPSRLRVEITEDLLADDVDGAIEILHQLQDVGVGLALDDFGTGYSSLSHLRTLPVDAIKIAKPFVDDLDSSLEQQAFVTAIITLGRNLRKFSIAEGIERPEQLDVLRAIGCDAGQGFLFARPMDEDGFTTWLHLSAKRNRAPDPSSAAVAPRTLAAVGGDRTGG